MKHHYASLRFYTLLFEPVSLLLDFRFCLHVFSLFRSCPFMVITEPAPWRGEAGCRHHYTKMDTVLVKRDIQNLLPLKPWLRLLRLDKHWPLHFEFCGVSPGVLMLHCFNVLIQAFQMRDSKSLFDEAKYVCFVAL